MSEDAERGAAGIPGVTEPERLDLRSTDVGEEKRQELLRVFPEVRTEGGKIDLDRFS